MLLLLLGFFGVVDRLLLFGATDVDGAGVLPLPVLTEGDGEGLFLPPVLPLPETDVEGAGTEFLETVNDGDGGVLSALLPPLETHPRIVLSSLLNILGFLFCFWLSFAP